MIESPPAGTVVRPVSNPTAGAQYAGPRALVPVFTATIFLGSFLMFAIEPMVGRRLLPALGGVPTVWNGCMVFFQSALLLGYGCAHLVTRWVPLSLRLAVYGALALLPLFVLRLGLDAASATHATASPLPWLLATLTTSIGPVFLALAVSASLLQASLAGTGHESGRDPYSLYVASNVGSLTALVAYPTVIEPWLGLNQQTRVWTTGYALFVALILVCAVMVWRTVPRRRQRDESLSQLADDSPASRVNWKQRARWCALACVPSSLLLGATAVLTTDIAPMPLLWVAPLALYLLTYILAFGRMGPRVTALATSLLPALLLALAATMFSGVRLPIVPALLVHLVPFTAAAMMCHGQLAMERPTPRHLTEFYFWLAFGGLVGGVFNTLAAPLLFSRFVEYPLALTLAAALRPRRSAATPLPVFDIGLPVLAAAFVATLLSGPGWLANLKLDWLGTAMFVGLGFARRQHPLTLAAVAGVFLLASPWTRGGADAELHAERTFFGTYRVTEEDGERGYNHVLLHGTTLHGLQSLDVDRRFVPLSYYHREGPFGNLMENVPRLSGPVQVAVIGLGVGTLASYARPGQQWTFYEIDSAVERIARDERYFTFLRRCGAACQVVLGDARISLSASTNRYDLIVLDAFSSDAIPVHLMTNEAMAIYLSHLAPQGVLAFHISNRHLRLDGILGRLAAANRLIAFEWQDVPYPGQLWPQGKAESVWAMMARQRIDLGGLPDLDTWMAPPVAASTPLWTDDFSNILGVLRLNLR